MTHPATATTRRALCVVATCAITPACDRHTPIDLGPDVQIVSEALRLRVGDPVPRVSPFFDGTTVKLVAARGETLAFQVLHRGAGTAALHLDGVGVQGYAVAPVVVRRPS